MKSSPNSQLEVPADFLSKMANLLGDDIEDFRASLDKPPLLGLRINTLKISPQAYTAISPFRLTPVEWCPTGFIVEEANNAIPILPPGQHPLHRAGLYYIQEPSAMAAAEILTPRPGEKVLDLAAAPGGKCTHIAAQMNNTGLLVANEIHSKRVWDLAQNLERCGVTNTIITNETPQRLADYFGDFFDRVMLDAPCSGEGMFRKNENARKDWGEKTPASCAIRQGYILEQAARLVKHRGTIVYSTCTFSPEENEGIIDAFLSKHPEFDIAPIPPKSGFQPARPDWIGSQTNDRVSRAIRIWPHLAQGEGHFIALLIKKGTPDGIFKERNKISPIRYRKDEDHIKPEVVDYLEGFFQTNLKIRFERSRLILKGTYIYLVPIEALHLEGIKVVSHGWWLGSIRKNRFIPSHALAMGMQASQAKQILSLQMNDPQLNAYFAGLSLQNRGEDGWVLVCTENFPLGWGKRVQNVIKNLYPRGLRRFS